MKSDADIKRDVEAELRWSPEVDDIDLAVSVGDGVVTLCGYVRTLFEKHRAESAAKRVAGVTAVADDLQVRIPQADRLTDPQIAREALTALTLELPLVWERIQLTVEQRQIVLEGTVEWHFQSERAECAMRKLQGVTAVRNLIEVVARTSPAAIRHQIEQAFLRSAEVDASRLHVEACGSEITLSGEVRSWVERDQAQATAWSAPGVRRVWNHIVVRT